MTYDTKSYELAEHFLGDEPRADGKDYRALAQVIQAAVEDWLNDKFPDEQITR